MNGRTHHRDSNHRPSYGSVHGSTHSSHSSTYGPNQRPILNHGTMGNHHVLRTRTPAMLPPVFPANTSCTQPYATYDQPRIRMNNGCKSFCTWKYACCTFLATTIFLTSLLVYVYFLEFPTHCVESSKHCGPVEAAKAAVRDDPNRGESLIVSDINNEGIFLIFKKLLVKLILI
ncbi:hypothetical protein PGB90_009708 [Kerria lacca]